MLNLIKYPLNLKLSDRELVRFCVDNKELNIERNENRELFISQRRTYLLDSFYNSSIIYEISVWNKKNKTGIVFDSNSAFFLPDDSMRGPDVAWISKERWDSLSASEKKSIPKIVPDFIIELQSETDNIKELKQKMNKWMKNGVKLAWLVSPQSQENFVYFENKIETVPFNQTLDGKSILAGLELIMADVIEE